MVIMVVGKCTEDRCAAHVAIGMVAFDSKGLGSLSMPALTPAEISAIDAAHVWHPYSTIGAEALPPVVAVGARGAWLSVIDPAAADDRPVDVLDAMSSWWTAIHGHAHPVLDAAITQQLATMNHVMFGGLTHEP